MIYQDVYSQQLAAGILPSADFIEDDLPLPSFQEVFGFTVNINSSGANIKNGKRKSGEGVDARHLSKRLRIDDFGGGGGKIVQHDSGYVCLSYQEENGYNRRNLINLDDGLRMSIGCFSRE